VDLGIKGRRAIVCASSKGLGRACAMQLANEGVHVTVTARGAEALKKTADEIRHNTADLAFNRGVRGVTMAWLSLIGFGVVLITYLGVNYMVQWFGLSSMHTYSTDNGTPESAMNSSWSSL
jgi:NAD(P)-dependent dehydrogenase (short-subunit alcohol dehydrogenase family)